MKARIYGDGDAFNTKVIDADTGEPIKNCYKAIITLEVGKPTECILFLHGKIEEDIIAEAKINGQN